MEVNQHACFVCKVAAEAELWAAYRVDGVWTDREDYSRGELLKFFAVAATIFPVELGALCVPSVKERVAHHASHPRVLYGLSRCHGEGVHI